MMSDEPPNSVKIIRSPQNFLAGVGILLVSLAGLQQSLQLETGSLRSFGPGMLPTALSLGLAVLAVVLVVSAFLQKGEALLQWSWRGPMLLCMATAGFALTIRTPGLAVAGPLVAILSGCAARDVKPLELFIFSICGTMFCIVLFKIVLGLPIPVLTIPGVVYW